MKYLAQLAFVVLFILSACGRSKEHTGHDMKDSTDGKDSPNLALYNQVQDIHEELMAKMEDLYNLKKEIQEKIAKTPGLVVEKKLELLKIIAGLDSADTGMMTWMHSFSPLPDSLDQEKAREYLETEMEKIKKLKEQTNDVIDKAKEQLGKK